MRFDERSAPWLIRVFGRGFGGLTVRRALIDELPERDFVYLGDTAERTNMKVRGKGAGIADGIRADLGANGGPGYDGVHIISPEGQHIGMILLPKICANLCFGGAKRNRLFMAASQSLYSLEVGTRGAHKSLRARFIAPVQHRLRTATFGRPTPHEAGRSA